MITKKILLSKCVSIFIGATIVACSSNFKQADIPNSANPQEEIQKLDKDLAEAATKNIDVLAPKEFKNSAEWLEEAKSDLSAKQTQSDILDDVRKSRGYLQLAYEVSENRAEKAPGLFQARQAAMTAGAANHPELSEELNDLDKEVSSKADNLAKVDSQDLSALQERYVDLERKSVILRELGKSQSILNGAKKESAEKRAPLTFKKAQLSLKNAESIISTNVRNPQGYKTAVESAKKDVLLLSEVMLTMKQNGKGLAESAALKMVSQNSRIKNLNTEISDTNAENLAEQNRLDEKNQTLTDEIANQEQKLATQEQNLDSAKLTIETQKAIENARTQFSSEEAEAYQQGGNLLIRLKQINFASGRSDLPGDSMALLAKVSNVAKSMNASEIKVEGHTDSTGSAANNKVISEKRATSVASYFKTNGFNNVKSEGYGFQKPIATNKSAQGRAQNRRVDIIISPENSSATK